MWRKLPSTISSLWCHLAHDAVMWPVHGRYQCRICGRHYPAFAGVPVVGRPGEPEAAGRAKLPAPVSGAAA